MAAFILCLECRKYLGRYKTFIEAYVYSTKILIKDILDKIHPGKLDIAHNMIPDLSDLLDSLGLVNMCCRTHILSNADFYSYLNYRTEL